MAIAFTNLGNSLNFQQNNADNPDINDGSNASTYTNSSWIPPTEGLLIVFVEARQGSSPPQAPTVTGNNVTWVQIGGTLDCDGAGNGLSLFAADASTAQEGITTVDFSGQGQVHCVGLFFQATGVDISGGVASAFVQRPSNTGSDTFLEVTLASQSHADNRPISCFWHLVNEYSTPKTDWTEFDDVRGAGQNRGVILQVKADAWDSPARADWSTSASCAGIAAELKATVSGQIKNFLATSTSNSATPVNNTLAVLRAYSATQTAASATPDASVLAVLRTYSATATAASLTPDNVDLTTILAMAAVIGTATATPDTVAVNVMRSMVAALTAASATPDTAQFNVLREMAAILTAASATNDVAALAVLRTLAAVLTANSATPDTVDLTIIKLMAAVLTAASATPDNAAVNILREMSAALTAATVTNDTSALAVLRALAAVLTANSLTPDNVNLDIGGVKEFLAVLTAASATPDTAALAVLREMAAILTAASVTPDNAVLGFILDLLAVLTAETHTPDDIDLLAEAPVALPSADDVTRWVERRRVVLPRRKPLVERIEAINREIEEQRPIREQMQEEFTKAQFEINARRERLEKNLEYVEKIIDDPVRVAVMQDQARRDFEQGARQEMREERKRLKKKQTALINLQKAQAAQEAARERQAELARQREQNLKKARRVLKKKRGG